ncbi:MAG: cupin domain protein [Moraxellaceae bacterium]|jgi:anti-sigma factor ChrR (cupin superfamily)|nr:cupin domain protein [Moraxellaceae bacterium]MDF3031546.1 cupin domain protein [Moraxellaceae bacterium]
MTSRPLALTGLLALLLASPVLAEKSWKDKANQVEGTIRDPMTNHNPEHLEWKDGPPSLPKGVKVATLAGDPFQPGPFVIRLKMPANYTIPPHWHSKVENVTVISGTLHLGMGDKVDAKRAHVLKQGGFHAIETQTHHYAISKTGAVVQLHGEGPFDITYVNPADNPDPAAKK